MFNASFAKAVGVVVSTVGLMMAASSASAVTVTDLAPYDLNASTNYLSFVPGFSGNTGSFTNRYAFSISDPANQLSSTINFVPEGGISPFTVALYSSTNCTAGDCNVGSLVSNFNATSLTEAQLAWTNVTAGYYYIEVEGTFNGPAGYSGQVSVQEAGVPLPGTVALLGLGLTGLAGLRRRKA